MKLVILKTKEKDFCIDISKTIYNKREDLILDHDYKVSNVFYDFLTVMIDKKYLSNIIGVLIADIDEIKDPIAYLGMNIIKNIIDSKNV